jgi:zinc transport system substrate-binding protein
MVLVVCGGSPDPPGESAGPATEAPTLSVYAVNYPLAYFAERIGGAGVEVSFPAPADVDPAQWFPQPEVVAAYQGADLILLNGAGYAKWVQRVSLPRARLVDTSASFRDRYVALEEAVSHGHGPGGEHSHEGVAFTTWLDPTLAAEQARAVADALARARPERESEFRERFARLQAELLELDTGLAAAAEAIGGAPLLFSHPVYQYLERRYALNGRSLHWEPEEAPGEAAWRELAALLEDHPATLMLWEGEPLQETVRRLEALGVASQVHAPCGNAVEEGDWLAAMRQNAARLRAAASEP